MKKSNKETINNYRQSLSILSSQVLRNSIGDSLSPSSIFSESRISDSNKRNTMNCDISQFLVKELERKEKKQTGNSSFVKLKSSLSHLENKITKAKKQLNTYRNIISEEDSEEDRDEIDFGIEPKNKILEENTTVGDSNKQHYLYPENCNEHIKKEYYISQLFEAIQGQNPRFLEHITISLKVLRNYHKLQSLSFSEIQQRKVNLPRPKNEDKKTLVIDVDETLIHCQEDSEKEHDISIPIQVQKGERVKAYIKIRPYAISFLKRMSKVFEIIAFTASDRSYADVVIDEIDPQQDYIKHRLYREHCVELHQNIYAKDLRILNRNLADIVLIDNAPYSYIFQLENGIPIIPYYSGEDSQLTKLERYLNVLSKSSDVRQVNKKTFKLHKYGNYSSPQELISDLYGNY